MGGLWFLLAVIFFTLWLRNRSDSEQAGSDNGYERGYRDGVAARDGQIRTHLADGGDINDLLLGEVAQHGVEREGLMPVESEWPSNESSSGPVHRTLSDHEVAAQKEATALRNMNTLLYFASFLLVAAAAAFIATSTPPTVRLSGLIAVVLLFYIGGLMLYKKVPRLKPAAVAFVGTGLAVLPFIGVALHLLSNVSESLSWLMVSVIGVAAYYVAAMVLRSQVVSYLTLAFVLSLASASVSVASLPILWYFVALIVVSLLATSVSMLAPKAVPKLFQEPVERTGQAVTPVVLVASLFAAPDMTVVGYQIIFALATAQYLIAWYQERTYQYETVVRIFAQLTLWMVAWDFAGPNRALFGYLVALTFILQAVYSLVRVRRTHEQVSKYELVWLAVSLIGLQLTQVMWLATEHAALLSSGVYVATAALGVAAVFRLRNARWGYVSLAMSLPLVLTLMRSVPEQPFGWQSVAVVFAALAGLSLVGLWYVQQHRRGGRMEELAVVAAVTYLTVMTLCGFGSESVTAFGVVLLGLTTGMVILSHLIRRPVIEVAAVAAFVGAVAMLLSDTSLYYGLWYGTVVVMTGVVVTAVATVLYHSRRDSERRDWLFGASLTLLLGLLFVGMAAHETVQQALVVILLLASLVAIGGRIGLRHASARLRVMTTSAYVAYVVASWLLVLSLDALWMALVCGVAVALFWLASFVERQAGLMIVGSIALVAAVAALWSGLELSAAWQTFGVGWICAAVLYITYWLLVERGDTERAEIQIISMWVLLGIVLIMSLGAWTGTLLVAWSLTLLFLAVSVGVYGYLNRQRAAVEVAIYLGTLSVQRLVAQAIPELNFVFYAHWWAVTVAAMAWWQAASPHQTTRWIIAMSFVTFSSGVAALGLGAGYQLLFLVEHVGLLAFGAQRSLRWAVWWGMIASSLAVLYFLRDYTYLWLAFLGLLLIGIVVRRLLRQK